MKPWLATPDTSTILQVLFSQFVDWALERNLDIEEDDTI